MTTQTIVTNESIVECNTFDEAVQAAGAAAVYDSAQVVHGVLYHQGKRRFFSSSLRLGLAHSIASIDSAKKKDDPSKHHNRPLEMGHVREIAHYLLEQDKFVLPPITLTTSSPMRIFTVKHPSPTKIGFFLFRRGDVFHVTDGQHRIKAIGDALRDRPELADDAIGVTFIEETDMEQVHQDFVDCAQSKPISPALLVEYDGRAPLNKLTRLVGRDTQVLADKVEKVGSVGKTSSMLFTSNQVKQGILHALVGDWSMYATAMEVSAHAKIDEVGGPDAVALCLVEFLDTFTEFNDQWRDVRNDAGIGVVDVPAFRERYLHFAGAGLLVMCGVAHSILSSDSAGWCPSGLSYEQRELVEGLASLDWSKSSDLWKGNLVGDQGNVTPHKPAVVLAVTKVKRELGIGLTDKEEARLRVVEEAASAPNSAEADPVTVA